MALQKTLIVSIGILVLIVAGITWFYLKPGATVSLTTYVADSSSALPGIRFSYPSNLGNVIEKPTKLSLSLSFQNDNQTASGLRVLISKDDSLGVGKNFTQWITDTYGYTRDNIHNPSLQNDASVATFTTIAGREALKIDNYVGDPNHSLYLLNLENGSVLIFAIQGATIDTAIRNEIANSINYP